MRTTKRPAWQITPGTHILIDGKERSIYRRWTDPATGRWVLAWGPRPNDYVTLDRLAPVVIVLPERDP